jgi:hypothetical protein
MRRSLITCLLAAGVATASGNGAVAQSACESRCQGNSACLKRCAEAPQHRSHVKPRHAAPSPSNDANDRANDWRERAFRIEGGSGGSGGSM